ncbi:MAG: HD domain-containing protein [Chloroflexi bacterium]|nr:HD domain-containing protein [Chloroflexota bacterium]
MNTPADNTPLPDTAPAPVAFTVPARHNPRLQAVVERISADEELRQMWRCANVNAVDRLGMSDHGEVHIRIVANAALRLLRLLSEAGHVPGVVAQHHLSAEDAEVVVVLAAALHDLGISIHRDNHEEFSLPLANLKAKELLAGLYPVRERTIIVSETLHAIIAHHGDVRCLTLEAGAPKVADALDMTAGRSRIPFEAGSSSIHAISAAAIDEVNIKKGESRPVRIEIRMSNSAGIFQVDELLRHKLQHSSLAGLVEVVASIESETEKRLLPLYTMGAK